MITETLRDDLVVYLAEDAADADVTTLALVPEDATGAAVIRAKSAGVVAGIEVARALFEEIDLAIDFDAEVADGARVEAGAVLARLAGPLRGLLVGERTALNLLQRMSGIATATARYVEAVAGTGAAVLATRKTAPGLRALDVAAVRAGGGDVHRDSLAAQVLVKSNHLAAAQKAGRCADMGDVVRLLTGPDGPAVPIGVEVRSLDELALALVPGVDVVLVDNFTPAQCAEAVRRRDAAFAAGDGDGSGGASGSGPAVEASGGITLETLREFADSGVERISVGALTHSVTALDISMTVFPDDPPA